MRVREQSRIGLFQALGIAWFLAMGTATSHAQDDAEDGAAGDEESASDQGDESGASDQDSTSSTKRERKYRGVVPGRDPLKKRKRKNALSWIGFQPEEDGSARVFLRLANEVPYEQSVSDGVLTVHLEGARYRFSNTSRRLDVHFFGTALHQITSERVSRRGKRGDRPARKAGIEVRIQFKKGVPPGVAQATMKTEEDGYTYLYLDFDPPGGSSEAGDAG